MKRRGDIWTANLYSGSGTEPGKTRPVVIFQSQTLLDIDRPPTIIMPLTTNLVEGPLASLTTVELDCLQDCSLEVLGFQHLEPGCLGAPGAV